MLHPLCLHQSPRSERGASWEWGWLATGTHVGGRTSMKRVWVGDDVHGVTQGGGLRGPVRGNAGGRKCS